MTSVQDRKHVREEEEEHEAVSSSEEEEEDDDVGPMPMPVASAEVTTTQHKKKNKRRKKKNLAFEKVYYHNLPQADMYEKSYMHRDIVTHVLVAPETQFIITASKDGHVKFWKKMSRGIEFVKHYKAHLSEILGLSVSNDGLRVCSTSSDQSIKFYDVLGFDMINMIQVQDFMPTFCCWIFQKGNSIGAKIAIADQKTPLIRIYRADSSKNEPLHIIEKIHMAPVTFMGFNPVYNCVVSGDQRGLVEYWSAETYKMPSSNSSRIQFKYKSDTDLFELAKQKTYATSICFDLRGENFVLTSKDFQIRVFRFVTGKMRRKYDESLVVFEDAQADGTLHLDPIDFGRRIAVEKEMIALNQVSNCVFDESGHFLLYPTLLGIKIVNIETNQVFKVLGKVENSDRFLQVALFQEKPKVNTQFERQTSKNKHQQPEIMTDETKNKQATLIDPILFCTSFKKNRFYLFSKCEPLEMDADDEEGENGRDVFNEKPTLEESQMVSESNQHTKTLGENAILHTTMGDIKIKLYPKECPKTVENFCTHARNGYYDNVIFHRVIKNFMIQTGDPLGDGTGGESIWGGEFEDEFHRNLRHDRAFTVSMANAGPCTNGSQFFITTVPTPWLDNKHTVFGRVENGKDTVANIEQTKTDKYDKPLEEIKIINVDIY